MRVELNTLVGRTKAGDVAAFTELTRRYQDMAFGYALSLLSDFHLAQDAVQEAFIASYLDIKALQTPDAFPGWLRGIVKHKCHRILRQWDRDLLPLTGMAREIEAEHGLPEPALEAAETHADIMAAVNSLPQQEREAVILFYMRDYSQQEVASFMGITAATVNNRLHAARTKLKRRMLTMVKETIKKNTLPSDFADRIGNIIQVHGPVVDAEFKPDDTPGVYDQLIVTDPAGNTTIKVTVAQRLGPGIVRAIATLPVGSLAPGMQVARNENAELEAFSDQDLAAAVRLLAGPPPEKLEVLETGIKVIDLFCPFAKAGAAGVFGTRGIGIVVLIGEFTRRLSSHPEGLALFKVGHKNDFDCAQLGFINDAEFLGATDTAGTLRKYWLLADSANDPVFVSETDAFDSAAFCSRLIAAQGLFPAIDCLISHSRLLHPGIVGQEHCDVVWNAREAIRRSRELMLDPVWLEYVAHGAIKRAHERAAAFVPARLAELSEEERLIVGRARKIERFMTQPFYVAEPFTKTPGKSVPRMETIRVCKDILDGVHDQLSEDAFLYAGGIKDVLAKAKKIGK